MKEKKICSKNQTNTSVKHSGSNMIACWCKAGSRNTDYYWVFSVMLILFITKALSIPYYANIIMQLQLTDLYIHAICKI